MLISNQNLQQYRLLVSIPCLGEFKTLPATLQSLETNDLLDETLVTVVVNNRKGAPETEDNQKMLQWLREYQGKLNLAWVDHSSPGSELPEKRGVGLARRCGFEYSSKHIHDDGIFIWLDGDTIVQDNYLKAIDDFYKNSDYQAGWVRFSHSTSDSVEENQAIKMYERHMAYYVRGLQYAGSVYAFPTIGSTVTSTARAYFKAGGVNAKRMAGEDFYFMQQLVKTGTSVGCIDQTEIYPSPRVSTRVPFGTGKAVGDILQNGNYMTYHPSCFEYVKEFIALVTKDYFASVEGIQKLVGSRLDEWLELNNFYKSWSKVQDNCKSKEQIAHQFICWFDAFRILKLIHWLTEHYYPEIDINELDGKEFS